MILFLMLMAATTECQPIAHDRILGSDLAVASVQLAALSPELVIAHAPRPGARRLFEPAELIRIAKANHLEFNGITGLCFERSTAPLNAELVKTAMRKVLDAPQAAVEILALSKYPAPPGEIVFPRDALAQPVSGDSAVWNGYVDYDGGRFPIWAKVHVTLMQSRLVSAVDLIPGHVIQASDLKVEAANEFPRRVAPLKTVEAAVGSVTRRAIPAGTVLTAPMFEAPNDVERGQTVLVEVHSGSAVVKAEGKAESAGRRGDTVSVRNATSGTLFRAQIEGKGRVMVKCRSTSEVSQ